MTTPSTSEQIIKLGFDKELVIKALKSNGDDYEKTVKFLTKLKRSGYDDSYLDSDSDEIYATTESEDEKEPLYYLKDHTEFNSLKKVLCREDPEDINSALKTVMHSISITDWQDIKDNQETFLNLLMNTKGTKNSKKKCDFKITEADKEKINKICSFGFSNHLAEQAFYACDKNVDEAVQLLK